MKLTLEILFNNADVVKAVIDRTKATQQDEIFWKRYLDFEETKSRVFKTYLGTVTGVTAGSIIDRNSNKPLRERKSLGSGYGEVAYRQIQCSEARGSGGRHECDYRLYR